MGDRVEKAAMDGDDGFDGKPIGKSGAITGRVAAAAAAVAVVVVAAVSCRYYSWSDCRPNCVCSPA